MRLGLCVGLLVWGCGSEEKFSIDNAHPVALITSHGDGDVVQEDTSVTLRGSVSDKTDPPSDLGQLLLIFSKNNSNCCWV